MMLRHHKSETAQNKFLKVEIKFQVLKLNQFSIVRSHWDFNSTESNALVALM